LNKYRTALKYVWLIVLVTTFLFYLFFPEFFTAEFLKDSVKNNEFKILISYVFFILIRPILLIPSTAVLIIGIALYPDSLLFLLFINMLGILIGATLLYYAGIFLTPEKFFSEKKMKSLPKIKDKINDYGFPIVLGWSFFPIVPTDLICFVAGATRMHFIKFITALCLGELILVSLYLWTGKGLLDYFF